ncbi:MAG: type II secretion system F family protein, partial [Planctomycetota bacterium]
MPTYTYEAINAAGKTQKGEVEAASHDEAMQRIRAQQLFPNPKKIQEKKAKGAKGGSSSSSKKKKKAGGGISFGG